MFRRGIIIIVTGIAVFFCQSEALSKVEVGLSRNSSNNLNSAFFIGEGEMENQKAYRAAHREEIKVKNKLYYLAHLEDIRNHRKLYYLSHLKKMRAQHKSYRLKHIEEEKAYRLSHSEKMKDYHKVHYSTHRKEINMQHKIYRLGHLEEEKIRAKKYRQSPEGKEMKRKSYSKRKQFGFIPLNQFFPGAEGHHINYNYVIYIPKKMHHSVWHSINLGIGMKRINDKAFKFLDS